MSDSIRQTASLFFIESNNVRKAFNEVRTFASIARTYHQKFAGLHLQNIIKARTLEEQLNEWGFAIEHDAEGNVSKIRFTAEKVGDQLKVLNQIAPYVKAGSYIEITKEDNVKMRWEFDGINCHVVDPYLSVRRMISVKKESLMDAPPKSAFPGILKMLGNT